MATNPIPIEIIALILLRLPPKPLCRFKCVSKPWQTLITSPSFIKRHFTKSKLNKNLNLLIVNESLSTATFPTATTTPLHFSAINNPFSTIDNPYESPFTNHVILVLGSCNGIFCLSDRYNTTVVITNPSTNTHRLIPFPPYPTPATADTSCRKLHSPMYNESIDHIVVYGFGYDPITDDYKLVRVIERYHRCHRTCKEVMVYSLKNDTWKVIKDDYDFHHIDMDGVVVNEYLLNFYVESDEGDQMFKCFDLRTETWSIFEMFDYDFDTFEGFEFGTKELGGCLCVMANGKNRSPMNLVRSQLWVMKEHGKKESWVKLFSISGTGMRMFGCPMRMTPVAYSKGGDKVLVELDSSRFGWYDWGKKKFERIKASGYAGIPWFGLRFNSVVYVDNLLSVARDEEGKKLKKKAVVQKNKNKNKNKNLDGFLSTGFKLRL